MKDTVEIRDEILNMALQNAAFDGWTWNMVCMSAIEAGHSKNTAIAVFPEKMVGVLDHFADWADREMIEALKDIDQDNMRVCDRIRTAVITRFETLAPHKEAMRDSLNFWLWPARKPRALKITWRTADVIWNWAGDTASDYNHYTKRGLLSGVIASATIFWLNDASEDIEKTKAFLDRRIENVMKLGRVVQVVKKRFC